MWSRGKDGEGGEGAGVESERWRRGRRSGVHLDVPVGIVARCACPDPFASTLDDLVVATPFFVRVLAVQENNFYLLPLPLRIVLFG